MSIPPAHRAATKSCPTTTATRRVARARGRSEAYERDGPIGWRTKVWSSIDDDELLQSYRMSEADLLALRNWQSSRPANNRFRMDMAFNSFDEETILFNPGPVETWDPPGVDALSRMARDTSEEFKWIHHT